VAVEAVRGQGNDLRAAFRTLSVHESRALLLYGIERRYPIQVVVGRSGSGKSRLLGAISRTVAPAGRIVLLTDLPDALDETTGAVAEALSISLPSGASSLEKLAAFADGLAEHRRAGRLVALLLDDAHLLSDPALGNVRLLAGTDAAGGALLPILLAGRPELVSRIESPHLDPFRTAISTHIELLRPLPRETPSVAPDDPDDGADLPREPRRFRGIAAGTGLLGIAALATSLLNLDAHRLAPLPPPPPLATPEPLPKVDSSPTPRLVVSAPPPPVLTAAPGVPGEKLTAASRLTRSGVGALIADLGQALEARSLARLEGLLARDARQNGMRGRQRVLDAYAYRFAKVDAPTILQAPERIVLQQHTALAEVPFSTTYRNAAGSAGSLEGVLHLRIASRSDRLVIDSLDYEFRAATP